jgi:hypothetical protein
VDKDKQEREEYREHVRSFSDALRASLAAKRGLTLGDLQGSGARGDDGEEGQGRNLSPYEGEGERSDEA